MRLFKVVRDPKTGIQTVNETTVCVLLEGDIETSYTKADNGVIVATDTVKNTIYSAYRLPLLFRRQLIPPSQGQGEPRHSP